MSSRRPRFAIALTVTVVGLASCAVKQIDGGPGGLGGGGRGVVDAGEVVSDDPRVPARVRRLSNAEYAASVWDLLGVDGVQSLAGFPRDATQKLGFTVNDAQTVSSVLASQFDTSALAVIAAARQNGWLVMLAACDDAVAQGESCARRFVGAFGAQAYRRALTADDLEPLLGLYRASVDDGGSYDDGIELMVRAILQAPAFLYLTELGDTEASSPAGRTALTPQETAGLLAYVATAAPPDQRLLDAAPSLVMAAAREQQLRRLLATPAGGARLVRLVREWLGIDDILEVDKDSTVYPTYARHHDAMAAESISFIEEVIEGGSRLRDLLGAEWSIIDTASGATSAQITAYYTDFYGLDPDRIGDGGRVSLSAARGGTRVGILNQGAFLSQFATATASHPVKRGVALMRRLACLEPLDPGALNINVVPPVPDPRVAQTTRALYATHASDPVCKGCHQSIDNFGFAFEAYDGMGAYRPNGQETVKTTRGDVTLSVDTAVTLAGTGLDLDGDYRDSNALAGALATSSSVRICMARQMFRGTLGRADDSSRAAEDAFLYEWQKLPADQQDSLIETLVALVRSDVFIERRTGS